MGNKHFNFYSTPSPFFGLLNKVLLMIDNESLKRSLQKFENVADDIFFLN